MSWLILSEICFCFQLGREVLDIAGAAVDVGVTTEEIDRIVHEVSQEGNS